MPTLFLNELEKVKPHIAETDCIVVPASMNAGDSDIYPFPLPSSWKWNSFEEFLHSKKSKTVLSRLPMFWQLEVLLYTACRENNNSLLVGNPYNNPVYAAAITSLPIDVVVSSGEDVGAFLLHLTEKKISFPPYWFVVHSFTNKWNTSILFKEQNCTLAQEVHLFPGVVVLTQCTFLSTQKDPSFHCSEETTLDIKGTESILTIQKDFLVPIQSLKISLPLEVRGVCACGKEVICQK